MPTYMKIEELEGSSTDARHVGWSDVDGVTYGVVNRGAERGVGQVQRTMEFSTVSLTRRSDHLTPQIIQKCATASVIPKVVIETCSGDAGHRLLRRLTLANVFVRELRPAEADTAVEQVELVFDKIKFEFANPADGVMASVVWDNGAGQFIDDLPEAA